MSCKNIEKAIVNDLIGVLGARGPKNKAKSFETVREKNWGPVFGAETPRAPFFALSLYSNQGGPFRNRSGKPDN